MSVILRPSQIAAVDSIEDAYRRGLMRPLADMCVGSGKSLTMAEVARRAWMRGERSIILAHRQELVIQNAAACRKLGLECGINASKLGERTWRGPVISAMINSVYNKPQNFGLLPNILTDECHLIPHSESGMYREFLRYFPNSRKPGFSGTVFRLQGGSLVEGEDAPFDEVVYRYSIIDGIRDGYLVPAFSAPAQDKIDPSKLKRNGGEYTGASQDVQTIDLMDSHIAQMKTLGADRRAWLIFEASQKAALAMTERLNAWGIPAGCIIDKTPNRDQLIADFAAGKLRALVNVEALTTGFDDQRIDLVCMRRKTKSLGLYIQIAGRGLRTIGGNITASIAAGKSDCLFFDFAGNIDEHGPLDFIRPKDTKISMVSCEECGARNARASMNCWQCDAKMTKLCPACLGEVDKGVLDCPHCEHDMRVGDEPGESRKSASLLQTPSGAALISSLTPASEREGGWLPIRKVWQETHGAVVALDENGGRWELSEHLASHAPDAKWLRSDASGISLLKPNGRARNTVIQVSPNGFALAIPMPPTVV